MEAMSGRRSRDAHLLPCFIYIVPVLLSGEGVSIACHPCKLGEGVPILDIRPLNFDRIPL